MMLKTITQAAGDFSIAPIRIHALLRQGVIPRHIERKKAHNPEILVDTNDVERYFSGEQDTLALWQANYEIAQRNRFRSKF